MGEPVTVILGLLKCAGTCIPQCLPQEIKDKLIRPVSNIILYRSNVAKLSLKLEELKRAQPILNASFLVSLSNGDPRKDAIQKLVDDTKSILESGPPDDSKCFCCDSSSCQVGDILEKIKKVLEDSKDFRWKSGPGLPPPIGSRYQEYNKKLLSRENMLTGILRALEETSMIGICGIPGVGKTTLLEEIIKRAEADNLFQIIAKPDLSQGRDTKKIQASIALRIQLDLTACGDDEEARASLLYSGLEKRLLDGDGSKLLLVFDPVFSASDLDLTKIGIPFRRDKCKILVSARSSDVVTLVTQRVGRSTVFPLDCLSPAEAVVLFRDKLGDGIPEDEYNSEAYISNENIILQSCGNLPMAITTTAKALKLRWSRRDDIVRDHRKYDLSQDDGVKQTLNQVSKMLLNLIEDDREKKIFLLCCLFKPGTSIPVESLVRYGLGLKLFGVFTKLGDIMKQANSLMNRLKQSTLLQSMDDDCIGMSAILHEFAISTALQDNYLLIDEGERNDDLRENFTVISSTTKPEIRGTESAHWQLEGLNSPQLEALFLKGGFLNLQDFAQINNLRVLVMTEMNIPTLPQSINCLKNLFTFCVEYCEIQDASVVGVLLDLEVLSFHGSTLGAYPCEIMYLKKVIVLDLAECCFGTNPDKRDAFFRVLKLVGSLEELEIEIPREKAGDLSPHHKLSSFKIAVGCKFPSPYRNLPDRALFLQDIDEETCKQKSFRNLLEKAVFLNLVEIKNLSSVYFSLPGERFVDLKFLHISRCNQMKCVLVCNGDLNGKIVPSLENLSLEQLDGLDMIYVGREPKNWPSKLRELKLLSLKELKCYALLREHACNLVVVEVTGCPKLNYFFSTCSTTEITPTTGDFYDLPFLKKLHLDRLPALKGMWTGKKQETDIMNQTDQLLFHRKISLPSLEELHLSSLDNIKEIWSEIPQESPGFGSLKEVSIVDCKLLESLCPPSVPAALSRLVTLKISSSSNSNSSSSSSASSSSSSNMKGVIKTETNSENAIKFPSLRRMELRKLQRLQWFSQGSRAAEFPSLEYLYLSSLPEMLSFHESEQSSRSQTPFITKSVFPMLELLSLCDMEGIKKLVEEGHCATAFQNLKTLTIIELANLECLPAALLEKIEELKIHTCGSLQGLFDSNFETSMSNLTRLELVDVSCCKKVPWKLIPNIESLVIRRSLLNLECMVSTTEIVESHVAQKLSYMEIEGCNHLEKIVSNEGDQQYQGELNYGTTMFPQLKHIKFHSLPSMITFSSGEYATTFPLLEEVEITGCPELKSFSLGLLHTVNLSTLILDGFSMPKTERLIDLNFILKQLNKGMPPSDSRPATIDNDGGNVDSSVAAADNDEQEMHWSTNSLLVIDDDDGATDSVVAAATTGGDNGDDHTSHNSGNVIDVNEGPAHEVENLGKFSTMMIVKNGSIIS